MVEVLINVQPEMQSTCDQYYVQLSFCVCEQSTHGCAVTPHFRRQQGAVPMDSIFGYSFGQVTDI